MDDSLMINAQILNSHSKDVMELYQAGINRENIKLTTSIFNKLIDTVDLQNIPKEIANVPIERQDAHYSFVYLKYLVQKEELDSALIYIDSLRKFKIVNIRHVNFLMRSLFIAKRARDAIELYQLISKLGLFPDEITFSILISNTMALKMYAACKQFVDLSEQVGVDSSHLTLLKIRFYGVTNLDNSISVFNRCAGKDAEIFAEMMSVYIKRGLPIEALNIHKQMLEFGIKDTDDTIMLFVLSSPDSSDNFLGLHTLIYERELKKIQNEAANLNLNRHLVLYFRKMFEKFLASPEIAVTLYQHGTALKLSESMLLDYVVLSHASYGDNSSAMTWAWKMVRKGFAMKPQTYRKVLSRMLAFKDNSIYSTSFIKDQRKYGLVPSPQHVEDFIRSNPQSFHKYMNELLEFEMKPGTFYRLLSHFRNDKDMVNLLWNKYSKQNIESGNKASERIKELMTSILKD